ncbi:acyl-CoA oxidase [Mycena crocata]|nr:acyl-CoA oxidase [Mycena crocata]
MKNQQTDLMDTARASASFDSRALSCIIYDGEENVIKREEAFATVEKLLGTSADTIPTAATGLDRAGLLHDGLEFGKTLLKYEHERNQGVFTHSTHHHEMLNASPFGLHSGMFIPALKLQASDEQLAYWLPLAEQGKIIGTYCQTELGHGTFLRGLETTATFDKPSDTFLLHSPTITSTKYWPGGLGYTSSHAVVIARLIVFEKDLGVHAFIVQLRSLEDHTPLPGVELGDIGMKLGLNGNDNGYCVFTRVRIPRTSLLMRHARVERDGAYTAAPYATEALYGTLLATRNGIARAVTMQLAQATTIAVRYSVVRQQGNIDSDGVERPIMAFQAQRLRVLGPMARAYALCFAAKACDEVYRSMGPIQVDVVPIHALTAGLKAYATQVAADGAEEARRACGGHGYSAMSGFADLIPSVMSTVTLEGENTVMYQQTARYLVKCAATLRAGGTLHGTVAYLANTSSGTPCTAQSTQFLDPDVQLAIFRHRAVRLVSECAAVLGEAHNAGMAPSDAWNKHMLSLIAAAQAHIESFVLDAFLARIRTVEETSIRRVLLRLASVFSLCGIVHYNSALEFVEDGYISHAQLRAIRALVGDLLEELVPDAVSLSDAWGFSDASLQSALGRRDGNVYETMLQWTRELPLNVASAARDGVQGGFTRRIQPLLKAKL